MKSRMSNFDIAAFVREARSLEGMKLEKAIQPDYSELWLRLSAKGQKATLVVKIGRAIWFEEGNLTTDTEPPHFAMLLRKYLANRTLIGIEQHEFDRVVVLNFSGQESSPKLIIELFSKGNVVLVEDGWIVQPLTSKSWRHRDLKSGAEYRFPPAGKNPMELSDSEIGAILARSDKDIVRALATEINLGGSYAEAICEMTGLHKNILANDLEESEISSVVGAIARLRETVKGDLKPVVIEDAEIPTDILPFPLSESQKEGKVFDTFNEALKHYFTNLPGTAKSDDEDTSPEIPRFERLAEQQENAIQEQELRIVDLQAAGETIYSNYAEVEKVLQIAKKVLEDNDWPDAKSEIETWENVEEFDPKTGRLNFTITNGSRLSLDVRKDVNENAALKYDGVKKARNKVDGAKHALQETMKELAVERTSEQKRKEIKKIKPTKRFWFESYRWFISGEGRLIIGGKDARSNDKVVKKHLKDDDLYVHAETQGAPSIVIKDGRNADEKTLHEACEYALCFSKAWNAGLASGSAYWVKPDQVSKTPQPGEFLARGAFVIRGKRNYSKKLDIRLAIGEIDHEGERKIMCGPVGSLEARSNDYFIIEPGDINKNDFSKRLAGHFNVPIEEISSILPPGDVKIMKEPGSSER